jgi:hypothetical protein
VLFLDVFLVSEELSVSSVAVSVVLPDSLRLVRTHRKIGLLVLQLFYFLEVYSCVGSLLFQFVELERDRFVFEL